MSEFTVKKLKEARVRQVLLRMKLQSSANLEEDDHERNGSWEEKYIC